MAGLMNITTEKEVQLWLSQPAGKPPAGVTPNFDNPSNLDAAVFSTIIITFSIAILSTIIRIYTKIFLIRSLAYEDYALALASWVNISAIIHTPSEFLVRLSILLQYLRIFVPRRRNAVIMHYAIYALIACNFVFYPAKFIGFIALIYQSPDFTYNIIVAGIVTILEVNIGTVVSCAPILPRFFQQHGHQITGLFHFPRLLGLIKRSKHFRLPSNTQVKDSHEYPSQTSPSRVRKYNGALTKQISGGDSFLTSEDGLPLNQISPTDSLPMAVIRNKDENQKFSAGVSVDVLNCGSEVVIHGVKRAHIRRVASTSALCVVNQSILVLPFNTTNPQP
ncbi:MAG: hypothetical protein Q9212_005119 [Teloschistes hypoglaucus]